MSNTDFGKAVCDPKDVPPPGFDMKAHLAAADERSRRWAEEACASGDHTFSCGHVEKVSGGTKSVQK